MQKSELTESKQAGGKWKMLYEEKIIETIPVGPLGLIPLKGCEELVGKVDKYLVDWRNERESEHKTTIAFSGYQRDSYIIGANTPRFGSGEAKGEIKASVRGDDLYLIDDGKIALHEEMDVLLDQYGLLKMDEATWKNLDKSWILRWKKESWGVSALTNERAFYQENYPKIVAEKGSVDEMVYMAVKGETV